MFKNVPVVHQIDFENITCRLETGLLAQQANATVMASMGDTSVLAAVVVGKPTEGDYFPLQVVYEERLYASGKIKGSRFIKREGRPSENAILTGRMIDRSVRSLFSKNLRQEVQLVITVLSLDEINPPDIVAVLAASAALKLALPNDFQGPVSSIRVGKTALPLEQYLSKNILTDLKAGSDFADLLPKLQDLCNYLELHRDTDKLAFREVFEGLASINSDWALQLKNLYQSRDKFARESVLAKYSNIAKLSVCPTYESLTKSDLDLVVSGDGNNIMMVEAGANIVGEEEIGEGLEIASKALESLTQFQKDFIQKALATMSFKQVSLSSKEILAQAISYWQQDIANIQEGIYNQTDKEARNSFINQLKQRHLGILDLVIKSITNSQPVQEVVVNEQDMQIAKNLATLVSSADTKWSEQLSLALDEVIHHLVHDNILLHGKRLDGRPLDKTRQISSQVGIFARTHGSSLFQRGETQVLNILTLGTMRDAQLLDEMEDFQEQTKRYIHHYNFPAYSVGETGRYNGPGRREIGHGALAEKALLPVLPSEEEFPYTMRLVSECLGSNGSTSMASTCGSCLSLLDGGVPLKDLVAGVAMGLVLDQNTGKFQVLTDILGDEDHFGDMDFKVTGTKNGVTAIQLDNKVAGLTVEILKSALIQAKSARMHILGIMQEAISAPRLEVSQYAPSVARLVVPVEKIGEVIGPSGKIIKSLIAKYEVDIDIKDGTGQTFIYGKSKEQVAQAQQAILALIKEYKAGDIISGKVFRIETYGAFVKLDNTDKEGLIHISQFSSKRVEDINTVVKMDQVLQAKVLEVNEKGQLSLTLKS